MYQEMAAISRYSKAVWTCVLILFISMYFGAGGAEAQRRQIHDDDMEGLREIAHQLGKRDWNLSLNHCDENLNWHTPIKNGDYNSTVNCTCPSDDICHISEMYLKGQDLSGVLPRSLWKLRYLKTIDFSSNYLSGPVPLEWGSMKLELMVLSVNRVSGIIPKELGNITSLKYMSLESNMFYGTVPAELGKLVNIIYLNLNSNNLTGKLPGELDNLKNLRTLRLSSNNFTGKLPIFQGWKQLQQLELEASGFEGPIPSNISLWCNISELRVTDLNGGEASGFPPLSDMTNMKKLMLRNCNITGLIPDYLVKMPLTLLDLSYNRLEGEIPNLENVIRLQILYLTRNLLAGAIPEWIKSRSNDYIIDLSYNNFLKSSVPPTCKETLNLFESFSEGHGLEFAKCLKPFNCSKNFYSLHINCGGGEAKIGDTTFEADEDPGGPAKFVHTVPNWGFSSTGHFWDVNRSADADIANNLSVLTINHFAEVHKTRDSYSTKNVSVLPLEHSQLYTKARVSPLSLTYYGRCLANGNYTVTLHFAEIVFRDNRSFHSLGRRIFDIYIQDEMVWKDFDIETVAQGVDKAVVLKFNNTVVKNNTITIHFYWAGKGTRAVPKRGTYGSLISAISVKSNFKPPHKETWKIYAVAGAVAFTVCLTIFIIFSIFRWKGFSATVSSRERDLRGLDLQTGRFSYRQIKAATNNFNEENKIGQGGFGSVYKGILADGTVVAVKQLSSKSKQGNREFVTEIGMISGLQHPNLVRLYGCCIEGDQLLLVYEYMENNSLARALFGPEECRVKLAWPTRLRICIGIARGLAFLHEESRLKIVHRDIKATNVLLDGDLNAKISDFGLAKLADEEDTHISTRVAGTIGYMAPEYALWGYLTHKADVYSFGVVALEIVAGKNNMKYRPNENYVCLLDWALVLQQKGCLMELVDPNMGSEFNKVEALRMIKVALLCTNPSPALRPAMSAVESMLGGHLSIPESTATPGVYGEDYRFEGIKDEHDEMQSEAQTLTDSIDLTQDASSSTSAHDLYRIYS